MDYGLIGVDWEERINFDRLRRDRMAKARAAVDSSDVDALLIFRPEDARYVTGFRFHLGPATNFGTVTVVIPKGSDPIIFTKDFEHARTRMPWLTGDQLQPWANMREVGGMLRFVEHLEGLLGRKLKGKVGVDLLTAEMHEVLQKALPNVEFVDGYEVLMQAKKIKTDDEIGCLMAANAITEAGLDSALRMLKPGVRECQLLAKAWETMTSLGSEWTQCSNIISSGPYTAPYRRFTSDRIIRMGDPVIIDIGGCFNGYWGDITRTWICGDIGATEEQIDYCQQSYDSLFAACDAVRPGNTNADVYAAAGKVDLGSLGHSAGTNPWEPPFLSPDCKDRPTTLEPNMVLNIEPWKGRPGVGGFRLENDVVVTEGEPFIYTTYPFDERLLRDVHPLDQTTGRTRR